MATSTSAAAHTVVRLEISRQVSILTSNWSSALMSELCRRCLYTYNGTISISPTPPPSPREQRVAQRRIKHTCGLINTRSMNCTTKSCSTYLSQNFPQFLHTVSRTPWPLLLSSAPEYSVYSVLTGYRHSMQMGIAAVCSSSSSAARRLKAPRSQKLEVCWAGEDECWAWTS